MKLQLDQVDFSDVVRDVSGRFAEELNAAGCQLELQILGPTPGQFDRLRLEQVVTNVLGNAIKYGRGKPIAITVEASATGNLCFQIQDHGIGIEAEKLGRIFGRFQRAVSSRSFGGLGLGLYITHQIVEAHGGTIRAESQPGIGSRFIIELPPRPPDLAPMENGSQKAKVKATREFGVYVGS